MRRRLAFMPAVDQTEIGVLARRDRIRRTLKKLSGRKFQYLNINRETNMRSFLLIAAAALSFSATMTFETTEANAVVCARGVVRAGCAGARGAVVVRKPVAVCRTVIVNSVAVRRCT
jgi:hypothetical protein